MTPGTLLFIVGFVAAVCATLYAVIWRRRSGSTILSPAASGKSGHCSSASEPVKLAVPTNARIRPVSTARQTELLAILAEVNDGLRRVPPIPQMVNQLMLELGRENSNAASIARLVGQEPILAAALLRVVNSAAYGLVRKVVSVEEAISYLGCGAVRSLAIRMELGDALTTPRQGGYDSRKLWQHSVAVSQVAEVVAHRVRRVDVAFTSTLGLLHDIGKLTINGCFPDKVNRLLDDQHWPANESFLAREVALFGEDHAHIGARLARRWSLPEEVATGIELHHTISDHGILDKLDPRVRRSLLVVAVANQLVKYAMVYCDSMEIDIIPEWIMLELGLPENIDDVMDGEIAATIARAKILGDPSSAEDELEKQFALRREAA